MKIFVFGNINLDNDSLSLRIMPKLQEKFPGIQFEIRDPNEEWDAPEEFVIIDTIIGIKAVKIFDSLDKFLSAPRVSMRDLDVLTNIRRLFELGKIKKIKVIGLSPNMDETEALQKVGQKITQVLKKI